MSGDYKAPADVGFWWGFKQLKDVKDFKGFKKWFTNVYWYHYKLPTFALLAGIAVVVYMIVFYATAVKPDATVLFATKYGFDAEAAENMARDLGAVIGSEEEPLRVDFVALNIGGAGEYAYAARTRFAALVSQQELLLMIIDDDEIELLTANDDDPFMPLDAVGRPGRTMLHVSECPGLDDFGMPERDKVSAVVVRRMSATGEQYEVAYAMLRHLMGQ